MSLYSLSLLFAGLLIGTTIMQADLTKQLTGIATYPKGVGNFKDIVVEFVVLNTSKDSVEIPYNNNEFESLEVSIAAINGDFKEEFYLSHTISPSGGPEKQRILKPGETMLQRYPLHVICGSWGGNTDKLEDGFYELQASFLAADSTIVFKPTCFRIGSE